MPQLRCLGTDFSPRIQSWRVRVKFVVNEVAQFLWCSLLIIIPTSLHTHLWTLSEVWNSPEQAAHYNVLVLLSLELHHWQLIKHYAMKAYGGADVYIHIFLTSVLVGGEWSASRTGHFTPCTHWIGGWVSQSGQNGEEKILDPTRIQSVTLQLSSL
jgi:hypothetical protein